jgi:hypothetical protein
MIKAVLTLFDDPILHNAKRLIVTMVTAYTVTGIRKGLFFSLPAI